MIVFAAFRENKGASGGPGGINSLIEMNLKNNNNYKFVFRENHSKNNITIFNITNYMSSKLFKINLVDKLALKIYKKNLSMIDPKLIVAHDIDTAIIALKLSIRYILVYHQQGSLKSEYQSLSNKKPSLISRYKYDFKENLAFLNAKKIVFPSKGALKTYLETCSSKNKTTISDNFDKVEIIYNSSKIPDKSEVIGEIKNLPKNKIIFLTVSSISYFKNVTAIPEYLSKNAYKLDFLWIIVGRGPLINLLNQEIERNNIADRTIVINRKLSQNQLKSIYDIADFYIMLHKKSIFDMATLEAMSMSCIPILSRVGGNLEFNIENNVLYDDVFNQSEVTEKFIGNYKALNFEIYNKFFSNKVFINNYLRLTREVQNK